MNLSRTASGWSTLRKVGALIIALAVALLFSYLLWQPLPAIAPLTTPSPRPDLLDRPHRPSTTPARPDFGLSLRNSECESEIRKTVVSRS